MSAALIAVTLTFLASIVLLVAAQLTRGSLRISLRLAGVWILLPSGVALIFLLLSYQSAPFLGTALSLAGIVLSFVFGIVGSSLPSLVGSSPITVGVIIASKHPFHREIRKGLHEELANCGARLIDMGGDPIATNEDETGFLRLVRRTVSERLDYAVIWCPMVSSACEGDVVELAQSLRQKGGLCIFLENLPAEELQSKTLTIRHDGNRGGQLAARAALDNGAGTSTKTLVLLGPEYTEPARLRNEALRKQLKPLPNVSFLELATWAEEDALARLCSTGHEQHDFGLVVCPNDSIALALEDASREHNGLAWLLRAKILGFDGLPRARACVAETAPILGGTISIPPSEYGARAGRVIRRLSRPSLRPFRNVQRECGVITMAMNEKNIITRARARSQLYGE